MDEDAGEGLRHGGRLRQKVLVGWGALSMDIVHGKLLGPLWGGFLYRRLTNPEHNSSPKGAEEVLFGQSPKV